MEPWQASRRSRSSGWTGCGPRSDRPEERATLTVRPTATPAQHAFRKWGWRKVARTRDGKPGSPVADVLLTTLPPGAGK
jgi:hypothetical protein